MPAPVVAMRLYVLVPVHAHVCPQCRGCWTCWAACGGQIDKRCARCRAEGGERGRGIVSAPCDDQVYNGALETHWR